MKSIPPFIRAFPCIQTKRTSLGSTAVIISMWMAFLPGWPALSQTNEYTFVTLAGPAEIGPGYFDGTGSTARFTYPNGIAVDSVGNLYVADTANHTIRMIGPWGVVQTLAGRQGHAGSADGAGSTARFDSPYGVAVDTAGNVYVGDTGNHTIRKIGPGGVVTTLAGRPGSAGGADGKGNLARFNSPKGLAVDHLGSIYVADSGNHAIRKLDPAGGVTTLAGTAGTGGSVDGTGKAARFAGPTGVAVDGAGNVYVADQGNSTIRKIRPGGVVTTLAGRAGNNGSVDGTGSVARFYYPWGVAVDRATNVYVTDHNNHTVRKIDPNGVVTTLAGRVGGPGTADGTGTLARFNGPTGIAADNGGNVYVVGIWNCTVRKIDPGAVVTTVAGLPGRVGSTDGPGSTARFYNPAGVALDNAGNVFVGDLGNHTIRKIDPGIQVTTPAGLAGNQGSADGTGSIARFLNPVGVAVDSTGKIYVADSGNHTIRTIGSGGVVGTLAGKSGSQGSANGTGGAARFNAPAGVAVDSADKIYVADSGNHTIRTIGSGGVVTTLAGLAGVRGSNDGSGSGARFYAPEGIATDAAGNVYVADSGNHTIRIISPAGAVTTLAGRAGSAGSTDGTGNAARFNSPIGVAVDTAGNIYVADWGNHLIRQIAPGAVVMTLAGWAGSSANTDGTGNTTRFNNPIGVAVNQTGNIYVADYYNHTIRVSVKTCPDLPVIDSATGPVGITRQLNITPRTANTCQWRMIRRPVGSLAELSATRIPNPTFTPDVADLYVFQLRATNTLGEIGIRNLEFSAVTTPSVIQSPADQRVVVGRRCAFTVLASGASPLSFLWFHGATFLGASTNATFVWNAVQPGDAGGYMVVVTNVYGAATSAPAVLTVTGDPPAFTRSLRDLRVKVGEAVALSAPATGWEPIDYQWFFNNLPLLGANQFDLMIGSAQLTNSGRYFLQASNYFGVSTSATAVVRVLSPLKITNVKTTNQIQIGQSLTLRATVEGDGPYQYQWQINGEAIPGATNETYLITNIQPKDGGSYRVLAANEAEVVAADIAEVIVSVPARPAGDDFAQRIPLADDKGVLRSTNEGATLESGEPKHAGKLGGRSIWFKWIAPAQGNLRLSTAGSSLDTLLGIYTGSLVGQLQPVASDEDRGGYLTSQAQFPVEAGVEYEIAIDGFAGDMGTVVLAWEFEPTPDVLPPISVQPQSRMVASGSDAILGVQATGAGLRYQWFQNGALIAGATNTTLVLTNVGSAQVGGYGVQVINVTGTKTNESQVVFVEVYQVVEGPVANPALGQDKLQDLTGAEAKATAASLGTAARADSPVVRWRVIGAAGLPPVSGYTVSRWGDTSYDTTQLFENQEAPVISGHSRWQALVVPYAGICTLSTAGSEFDTVLEVVRMDGVNLVRVAYDDNSGPDGKTSWLQFEADPVEEYYVRVAGVGDAKGKYQLTEVFEVPQRYRQWEYRAGEGYVFTLQVPKTMVFRVEGSQDLRQWEGILSTNSVTGLYEFRHSDNQRYDHRFYRAILFP